MHNNQNIFVGLSQFIEYVNDTTLHKAFWNSLSISCMVTLCSTSLAFLLAFSSRQLFFYGCKLTPVFAMLPLFAPSLFPAIGLQYLLGRKGIFHVLLQGHSLYGKVGLILAFTIYTLPHAFILVETSLSNISPRLYFVSQSLSASTWRQFITITVPHVRYGVVSAASTVFILTFTDFGIPKVIGGSYSMLATEIYSQVVGLQNFSMGSAISIFLMLPSVVVFALDLYMQKKQRTAGVYRNTYRMNLTSLQKYAVTLLNWSVFMCVLLVIGVVVLGSCFCYWPYNLSLTLRHYDFSFVGFSVAPFVNSLILAFGTAIIGSFSIFFVSYVVQRLQQRGLVQKILIFMCILPLSIPGTVLGLAYLFAFNSTLLTGNFILLILNTIIHFFTVSYLSFSVSLKKLPGKYEFVGRSMGVSALTTCRRVVLPLQKEVIADVFFYLFLNALITVSALIFLYTPDTLPAAIAILHMEESGYIASASAMGTLLLCTALTTKIIHIFFKRIFLVRNI
jgi:iron(III) transport system permease protein